MPQLDKSSKKYICPKCDKKTFVIYLTDEGKEINNNVGRCDREDQCGLHYSPKEYYSDNGIDKPIERTKYTPPPIKPPYYIDIELIKGSLSHYDKNNFVQFLEKRFGKEVTTKAVERYFIGTSKRWNGANIFYQFDEVGKCRTGKIMLYNPETGKRIKEPNNCIDWLHTKINKPDYNLNQCLFGSHLFKDRTKVVNIVESEKTAVICSIFYPQCIWVATGGKENLKLLNASSLKNRDVTLYPDLKAFDKWSAKTKELNFQVSDYLERIATPEQREAGEDLADFLLRLPPPNYLKDDAENPVFATIKKSDETAILPEPIKEDFKAVCIIESINKTPVFEAIKKEVKEDWSEEIEELKKYFDTANLPPDPIRLNQCTVINNSKKFIECSLIRAMANNGNAWFRPEIDRLIELKKLNELRFCK